MPEITDMFPVTDLQGTDVLDLAVRARGYIGRLPWWKGIKEEYLAWALAPIVGVFFFKLEPARPDIDKELWVIVGDLPPAYIVCDNVNTWQDALDTYGGEMMKWVEAVRDGKSVEDIIPVNVEPSKEYADMLETRIKFIWEELVDKPSGTYPSDT